MKRAPIVMSATVAGLAGVVGFPTHPLAQHSALAAAPSSTPTAATQPSTAAATVSASTRRTSTTKRASTSTKTATGAVASNQYGDVRVRVSVSGGKITRVTALDLPMQDPKSQEISSYAEPQLRQQALQAQSASIDGVSGASYTSESYKESLQSALDQLGFKA